MYNYNNIITIIVKFSNLYNLYNFFYTLTFMKNKLNINIFLNFQQKEIKPILSSVPEFSPLPLYSNLSRSKRNMEKPFRCWDIVLSLGRGGCVRPLLRHHATGWLLPPQKASLTLKSCFDLYLSRVVWICNTDILISDV